MEWLISGAVAIVGGIAATVGRGWLRRVLSARLERAILRGRRPSVPVFVKRDRLRYSRAVRHGSDLLVFSGLRGAHLVDARQYRDAATRVVVDENGEREGGLRALRDSSGLPVFVGPSPEYEPALRALADAAPSPLSPVGRVAAAVPRSLLVITMLSGVLFVAAQAVWWTGHDVSAQVTKVVPYVETDDGEVMGDHCLVAWVENGRQETAGVTCYEPYPAVGGRLTVRALAGPLRGNAMDHVESYAGLTAIFGGLLVAGAGCAGIWAGLRARAVPQRLTAQERPRTGPLPPASASHEEDFLDVAVAVARAEGWADDRPQAPEPPGRLTELGMALSDPWWFGVVAVAGISLGFLEGETTLYAACGLVLAAAVGVVCLVRSWQAWRLIRSPYDMPFSRELPYVVTRTVDDEWTVFLLEDGRPRWAVDFSGERHPPLSGTAEIRGDLGKAVHLRIDGALWMPDSPAFELDRNDVLEVRAALREGLEEAQD